MDRGRAKWIRTVDAIFNDANHKERRAQHEPLLTPPFPNTIPKQAEVMERHLIQPYRCEATRGVAHGFATENQRPRPGETILVRAPREACENAGKRPDALRGINRAVGNKTRQGR